MHPAFAAVPLLYLSVLVPIKETVDSFVGIKKITDRCTPMVLRNSGRVGSRRF